MNVTRSELLVQAEKIITADRQEKYGDPHDSFDEVAKFWNTYLGLYALEPKYQIKAEQVPMMLTLLKVIRSKYSPLEPDHYVDIAGYTALSGEIAIWDVRNEKENTL